MTTTPESRESVEQLATLIVDGIRGNPHQTRAGKVGYVEGVLLGTCWKNGIDPATMKPIEKPVDQKQPNYETAWLIEKKGPTLLWYVGEGKNYHNWTASASKAQRFETKQQAENVIDWYGFDAYGAIATEHGFDSMTVEELQQRKEQPAPQPEVAVGERDRELAGRILRFLKGYGTISNEAVLYYSDKNCTGATSLNEIISTHMATERAEAKDWETVAKANADALAEKITQLAETEAKLKAAEKLVKELEHVMGLIMRRAASIANDAETYLKSPPTSAE